MYWKLSLLGRMPSLYTAVGSHRAISPVCIPCDPIYYQLCVHVGVFCTQVPTQGVHCTMSVQYCTITSSRIISHWMYALHNHHAILHNNLFMKVSNWSLNFVLSGFHCIHWMYALHNHHTILHNRLYRLPTECVYHTVAIQYCIIDTVQVIHYMCTLRNCYTLLHNRLCTGCVHHTTTHNCEKWKKFAGNKFQPTDTLLKFRYRTLPP